MLGATATPGATALPSATALSGAAGARPATTPPTTPALAAPAIPPPPAALAGLAPLIGPAPPAAPHPAALTIPFPPGQAELTAAETAAIAKLVHATPQTEATSFSVLAYAAGSPQNPSAARRLALARALAVHDALLAAGVPGVRIFLRAVGPPHGPGAPDRAELRVNAAAGTSP
ncbi:MAG: OmpA family protein [Acetobacteraceae bacterium]